MSKNITIQEGGTAKSMTVHKLKTNLVGGGTCLWVPEDEVSLGTKHITENGTYTASDDSKYGYLQVTVNVPGGAGSASNSGTPTTSGGTTPGGVGSAVIGTDPTDGNEYGVGVDENGNLVTTKIPSSINIGKAPDKTEYSDGETIDYGGIIVTLKGADGEPFSNSDYPNGRIPFEELLFPITIIDVSTFDENIDEYSDGEGVNAILITYSLHLDNDWKNDEYIVYADINHIVGYKDNDPIYLAGSEETKLLVTRYNQYIYVKKLSGNNARFNYTRYDPNKEKYKFYGGGSTAYRASENWSSTQVWNEYLTNLPVSTSDPLNAGEMKPTGIPIPVQWTSPYDGRTFEATFDVIITMASGSENSGNEGGGGGHSF